MALQGKTGPVLEEEENKIKVVALRTTNNINMLIKVGIYCLFLPLFPYSLMNAHRSSKQKLFVT